MLNELPRVEKKESKSRSQLPISSDHPCNVVKNTWYVTQDMLSLEVYVLLLFIFKKEMTAALLNTIKLKYYYNGN